VSSNNPFHFINAINDHKEPESLDGYVPFLVQRGFSYFIDTVLYANEINGFQPTPEQHFDYLFHSIKKRKRFSKWAKKTADTGLTELVAKKYNIRTDQAEQYLKMMDDAERQWFESELKRDRI
jgi:hypothetical protein